MNRFIRSATFIGWLDAVTDGKAKARIIARLRYAELGNFGDCEPVGEGVSEMRIPVGQGYRVYYTRIGEVTYYLLIGGDKSSQTKDIVRAIKMSNDIRERKQ